MKNAPAYPVIDVPKTGRHIRCLMDEKGFTVKDVMSFLGLEYPRAVYHWLSGNTLPTVDHLCALSKLLEVSMDDILILKPEGPGSQPGRARAGKYCNILKLYGLLMAA